MSADSEMPPPDEGATPAQLPERAGAETSGPEITGPEITGKPTGTGAADEPPDDQEPVTPSSRARSARRRRSRLLVMLGVVATGLGGAIWAAVTGSVVENGRNYITATLDTFRRGEEIKVLNARVHDLELQNQQLLHSNGAALSAYIGLAYRDKQFCFEELRKWARDGNYAFEPTATPAHFMARVSYYGAPLMVRCAGAQEADWTYIIMTATETQSNALTGALQDLSKRLEPYGYYPDAVNPPDNDWTASGPWVQAGFITIEMPFGQYLLWAKGVMPEAVASAITRPSSKVIAIKRNGYLFYTAREPGSSLTLRSPPENIYQAMDSTGTWHPYQEVLPPGVQPVDTTPVRADVMIVAAGTYLGVVGGSMDVHYLGTEATGKLMRIPGVQDSGNFLIELQNW